MRGPDLDHTAILRHLSPLAYVNPGRFSAVSETLSFPFPAGFSR